MNGKGLKGTKVHYNILTVLYFLQYLATENFSGISRTVKQ